MQNSFLWLIKKSYDVLSQYDPLMSGVTCNVVVRYSYCY